MKTFLLSVAVVIYCGFFLNKMQERQQQEVPVRQIDYLGGMPVSY